MTNEQKDALSRVKAAYSSLNYSDRLTGDYRTEEMGLVLDIVEEQSQILLCIKHDLETILNLLENRGDFGTASLVKSSLEFLRGED